MRFIRLPGEVGGRNSLESGHDKALRAPAASGSPDTKMPPGKCKSFGIFKAEWWKGWDSLIPCLPPPQIKFQFICRGHSSPVSPIQPLHGGSQSHGETNLPLAPQNPVPGVLIEQPMQPLRFWGPVVVLGTLSKGLLSRVCAQIIPWGSPRTGEQMRISSVSPSLPHPLWDNPTTPGFLQGDTD